MEYFNKQVPPIPMPYFSRVAMKLGLVLTQLHKIVKETDIYMYE
jgi:hypothetical protein